MCSEYYLFHCDDRFGKCLYAELYVELNLQIQMSVLIQRLELP